MDSSNSSTSLAWVLSVLIPLGIACVAVFRGEQAWRERAEALIRARTHRACISFLVSVALAVLLGVGIWLGLDEVAAILLGGPAAIAFGIGLFNALMVWRVRPMLLALFATAVTAVLVWFNVVGETGTTVVAVAHVLLVLGAAVVGLRRLRAAHPS